MSRTSSVVRGHREDQFHVLVWSRTHLQCMNFFPLVERHIFDKEMLSYC